MWTNTPRTPRFPQSGNLRQPLMIVGSEWYYASDVEPELTHILLPHFPHRPYQPL